MSAISPIHAAFGQALRELRLERHISQEGLALKSGLSRGYYGGIERGERNVSLTNITKLATALDIPASAIHARAEQIAAQCPAWSDRRCHMPRTASDLYSQAPRQTSHRG